MNRHTLMGRCRLTTQIKQIKQIQTKQNEKKKYTEQSIVKHVLNTSTTMTYMIRVRPALYHGERQPRQRPTAASRRRRRRARGVEWRSAPSTTSSSTTQNERGTPPMRVNAHPMLHCSAHGEVTHG